VTYACPNGIIHYIACHGYQPPPRFCEAVLNCPAPDTAEFFAALHTNGWPEPRPADPEMIAIRRIEEASAAFHRLAQAKLVALDARRVANGEQSSSDPIRLRDSLTWTYTPGPAGSSLEWNLVAEELEKPWNDRVTS
jgi:hypothetical protein